MLFYSFFKTLVGHDIVVELKNNTSINGKLHSVDQYLNIKLTDVSVDDPEKHPHLSYIKDCFIRGSVVRYVQLPEKEVDTQLLQDAARKTFDILCDLVASVDVEHSFSTYKNILTDRRTNMTPEHMEQNIVVNCFQKFS